MRASYFGDLIRSYQEKDKWLRVLGLVLSSGALGSALLEVDQKYKVIASLIAAACSYWLLVSQYSTFSREASDLMSSWQTLATRYEKLWNNLDAPEAECTFDKI